MTGLFLPGRARLWSVLVLLCVATGATAQAAEQRRCDFGMAVFPSGNQRQVDFPVVIASNMTSARVRVEGSGEWPGTRRKLAGGTDVVVFDTGPARETITIGPTGEALWEIAYRNGNPDGRVTAFVGTCAGWRAQ